MTLDRRRVLGILAGWAPTLGVALPAAAAAVTPPAGAGAALDAGAFGVTPGRAGPQTGGLQRALDAAAERGVALSLPAGTIETGPLTLRPGSRVFGAGPSTRLVRAGAAPVFVAERAPALVIADLTVSGRRSARRPADTAPLVALAGGARLALARLNCEGGQGHAISLERCSGTVSDCVLAGAGRAAIFSTDATGLEIVDNVIEDCADNGILVWRSRTGEDGTIVARNRIRRIAAASGGSGEHGNAINLYRAGGVIVAMNRIEDCAYSAIRANSASNAQVTANSCARLGEVAIYAEFAFEGAVISDNIVDDAASGISITNFDEGGRLAVCSGNIVRNLRFRDHADRRGNGIGAEADTLVTANVVENAPGAGITLGWGPHLRNVVASDNIVRRCGTGIAVQVVAGAGAAVITNNLIAAPRGRAIQGFEWERPVGGELVAGAPARWRHLTIAGNVVA